MDWTASLSYLHEHEQGALNREYEAQDTGGQIGLVSDLVYRRSRDVMQLRGEAGLFKDLSLFTVLSFVLADQRSLDFDQGNNCASQPNGCVDATNSTTLRDGILPGYGTQLPSTTVFRGPTRRGFEYWGLGANWAVFNQARDDTQAHLDPAFRDATFPGRRHALRSGRAHQEHGRGSGLPPVHTVHVFLAAFRPAGTVLGAWVVLPVLTSGSPFPRPG